MKCAKCRRGTLEAQSADIQSEVKGEIFAVRVQNALVCPRCGYKTVPFAEMPEYMKLAADEYRRKRGLLTSSEIRSRRASLRMSQEAFAAHLKVGVASIKRWEMGQVQDEAMDHLIRLCTDVHDAQKNLATIQELSGGAQVKAACVEFPHFDGVYIDQSQRYVAWESLGAAERISQIC